MTNINIDELLQSRNYFIIDRLCQADDLSWLPCHPIIPHGFGQPHLFPVLVNTADLKNAASDRLRATIHHELQRKAWPTVDFWFSSDLSTEQLCRHFRVQMALKAAAGERPRVLRFYDPRVLPQLWWMLPAHTLRLLLGGMLRPAIHNLLIWIDGQWQCLPGVPDLESPIIDKPEQLLIRLERIRLINLAMIWSGQPPADIAERMRLGQIADRLIETAQERYGITQETDCLTFVVDGLKTHEKFHEHPAASEALKRLRSSKDGYRILSLSLGDGAWQEISNECFPAT